MKKTAFSTNQQKPANPVGKVGNGPMNTRLNFDGDPDHRLDTGIVFWIHHYWEIRQVA